MTLSEQERTAFGERLAALRFADSERIRILQQAVADRDAAIGRLEAVIARCDQEIADSHEDALLADRLATALRAAQLTASWLCDATNETILATYDAARR